MDHPRTLVATSRESIEEDRRQRKRWLLWENSLTKAILDAKRARKAK